MRWDTTTRKAALAMLAIAMAGTGGARAAEAEPSRPGTTERVSVRADGAEPNSNSIDPALTPDGRFVAFQSSATNLVPGDTNERSDIFVKDRWTGSIERVSIGDDGSQGNGFHAGADISADGRFVSFMSNSTTLVAGAAGYHVYVRDRVAGRTQWASRPPAGLPANGTGGFLPRPSLTPDGRFVAFSTLDPLDPADVNKVVDVYLRDLVTDAVEWISVDPTPRVGFQSGDILQAAVSPSVSADGDVIAFSSARTLLVPEDTGGGGDDVFVRERATKKTTRVSVSSQGVAGNGQSRHPAISDDGRRVVFSSYASSLVPNSLDRNGLGMTDVYLHDRATGRTRKISVTESGEPASGANGSPTISADGRVVAWQTTAANLIGTKPPLSTLLVHQWQQQTIVADVETGELEIASVSSDGTLGGGYATNQPSVSGDGRYVAFNNTAADLVPGDTNKAGDIFLRDRGPSLGAGGIVAQRNGTRVDVTAWATARGAVLATATDPNGDAPAGMAERGGELTGATLSHLPARASLQLRLAVARMPKVSGPGADSLYQGGPSLALSPGIMHGLEINVGTRKLQIRVTPAEGDPGSANAGIFESCGTYTCSEVDHTDAWIGTTDDEVVVEIPLWKIGAGPGTRLDGLRAFTATAAASDLGTRLEMDTLALGEASVPWRTAQIALGPAGAAPETLTFSPAAFGAPSVWGSLPAGGSGPHEVWVRACSGTACATASRTVTL